MIHPWRDIAPGHNPPESVTASTGNKLTLMALTTGSSVSEGRSRLASSTLSRTTATIAKVTAAVASSRSMAHHAPVVNMAHRSAPRKNTHTRPATVVPTIRPKPNSW